MSEAKLFYKQFRTFKVGCSQLRKERQMMIRFIYYLYTNKSWENLLIKDDKNKQDFSIKECKDVFPGTRPMYLCNNAVLGRNL